MHYKTLVLVKMPTTDFAQQIKDILAPYHDDIQYSLPDDERSVMAWDWYQVGGRWDGYLPENTATLPNVPEDIHAQYVVSEQGSFGPRACYRHDEYWTLAQPERNAMQEKAEKDWQAEFPRILGQHRGYTIFVVDIHD